MNIINILSLAIIPLTIYSIFRLFKNRNFKEQSEHVILELSGVRVSWYWVLHIILWGIIFYPRPEREYNYFLVSVILCFLIIILVDITFQIRGKNDRLILKEGEIILLKGNKMRLGTQSIYKISMNGLTSKITVKGDGAISFSKNRLSKENLAQLRTYLNQEIILDKIEISDNLKSKLLGITVPTK